MRCAYPLALMLAGCASVGGSLREPVTARCQDARLQDCDRIAEDVVAYADGDRVEARADLDRLGTAAPPADLYTFARSLSELRARPEGRDAGRALSDLAALFAWRANAAERARLVTPTWTTPPAPTTPAVVTQVPPPRDGIRSPFASLGSGLSEAPDARPALTADTDPSRLDGGTAGLTSAPRACLDASSAPGLCSKIIDGAIVITDLHANGCGDVFVAAGKPGAVPRWSLQATAARPLSVHGARLVVRADELVAIGAVSVHNDGSKKAKGDTQPSPACALVWAGFRPYAQGPRDVPNDIGY